MSKLIFKAPSTYILPQEGGMHVPGLIIAQEAMIQDPEIEKPLQQVRNVAYLKGIRGHSIAMPDIHWGYGFPIGGVAAMDAETGVISPGGVGYDINCGVRLALLKTPFRSISDRDQHTLLKAIYQKVPSGVGQGRKDHGLSDFDYEQVIAKGVVWAIEQGYGLAEDVNHTESHGNILGGHLKAVSDEAKLRGKHQLGTIGSGNHFIEIGEVDEILLQNIASAWNVEKGSTYILIHSGSRGFGHQICQDSLDQFILEGYDKGLPDKQLVSSPITSAAGKKYFAAMASAANFAFNNRQFILHSVREAFKEVLKVPYQDIRLLYDVCHNIAKFEEHMIEGKKHKLCVHRKGATRAFGPGHEELNPLFRQTGQPVLVPGDMGRASYLLVGLGNPLTFCSACHGAGRARSRMQSLKKWRGENPILHMHKEGVKVMALSTKTVAEEMPDAYKDVETVVEAVEQAKLANKVARLKPKLVIKG